MKSYIFIVMYACFSVIIVVFLTYFLLFIIQELFGQCGADKADDDLWLKLSEIHLPHNGLTELDASLV